MAKHDLQFMSDEEVEEDSEDPVNACQEFGKTLFWEANQKSLSSAVWMWLIILEASERNILQSYKFGPKLDDGSGARLSFKQTRDQFMKHIDDMR